MKDLSIVCWKWDKGPHPKKGIKFTAEHVNILRASVARNLSRSHVFVCVTDDHKGLHPEVQVVNIDRHFKEFSDLGGCYRRLKAFDMVSGLALFGPRFVSIDLDVVITGNLDDLFGFQEDFRIWEDNFKRRTPYCGSLWGMKSGSRGKVWDKFKSDPGLCVGSAKEQKLMGTDQAHISHCLYPQEKTWTVRDGVYNFGTRVRMMGGRLPVDCKMVFFNGKYDPSQGPLQENFPWIKDHWHE
jgi:hypothetical protein